MTPPSDENADQPSSAGAGQFLYEDTSQPSDPNANLGAPGTAHQAPLGVIYPAQPGMAYPAPLNNGLAVAGFVCALVALVFFWVPFLNFVVWVCGLVFSIIGYRASKREGAPHKGLAVAGIWISAVPGLILVFVFGIVVLAALLGGSVPA